MPSTPIDILNGIIKVCVNLVFGLVCAIKDAAEQIAADQAKSAQAKTKPTIEDSVSEMNRRQSELMAEKMVEKEQHEAVRKQQSADAKPPPPYEPPHETDEHYRARMEDFYRKREIGNEVAAACSSKTLWSDRLPTISIDSVEHHNKFLTITDSTPRVVSIRTCTISNIFQECNVVHIHTSEYRQRQSYFWKLATDEDATKLNKSIHAALS